MAGKTAKDIRELNTREPKAWKVIDQCLSEKEGIPAKVRLAAAEFILKRLYPEKHILAGDDENPVFIQTYLPENKGMSNGKNGHSVAAPSGPAGILPHDKRL